MPHDLIQNCPFANIFLFLPKISNKNESSEEFLRQIYLYLMISLSLMNNFNSKNTFLIVHKAFEFALEIPDESFDKKSAVELGPVNQNNHKQLWLLNGRSAESVEIVNGFSDYCLTEDGDKLILKRGTGNKSQTWALEFVGEEKSVQIKLSKSKNKYLAIHEGELVLKEAKPQSTIDAWKLIEVTSNDLLKKSCFIVSTDTKKLIDIPEGSKKQGEEIIVYQANYRYNQRWNIFKAGEIYVIKSFYNKMNLDVAQEKFQQGTPIIQYMSHGGVNQFWRFQKLDPHKPIYRIYTCYDKDLELGHGNSHLKLFKGRKFSWEIDGYFPE